MAKKLEVIYADDAARTGDDARDEAARTGQPVRAGDVRIDPAGRYEGAVLSLNNGDEVLFVRAPIGRNRWEWRPVARFKKQTVGKHEFLAGRPFRGVLTARQLGTLERLYGREYGCSEVDEKGEWQAVELDAVETVRLTGGIRIVQVCYRGLWFGCLTRHTSLAPATSAPTTRNYPALAIT